MIELLTHSSAASCCGSSRVFEIVGAGIDAGNPDGCLDQSGAVLATDRRAFLRTARCDMGGYEFGSSGQDTPTNTAAHSGRHRRPG